MWIMELYNCFLKKHDPLRDDLSKLLEGNTKYMNSDIFLASFILPNYAKTILESNEE
jgi:spermidine synthase